MRSFSCCCFVVADLSQSRPNPDDPNDSVLASLQAEPQPYVQGGLAIPGDDARELHAHPDLDERLDELVTGLPAMPVAAYGYPAYAHANGVFAFARGMYRLYFRLATREPPLQGEPAIGRDGTSVDAFMPLELERKSFDERLQSWKTGQEFILGQLRQWAREAHEYAAALQSST